jgi:hypothetical protein
VFRAIQSLLQDYGKDLVASLKNHFSIDAEFNFTFPKDIISTLPQIIGELYSLKTQDELLSFPDHDKFYYSKRNKFKKNSM